MEESKRNEGKINIHYTQFLNKAFFLRSSFLCVWIFNYDRQVLFIQHLVDPKYGWDANAWKEYNEKKDDEPKKWFAASHSQLILYFSSFRSTFSAFHRIVSTTVSIDWWRQHIRTTPSISNFILFFSTTINSTLTTQQSDVVVRALHFSFSLTFRKQRSVLSVPVKEARRRKKSVFVIVSVRVTTSLHWIGNSFTSADRSK